MKRAADVLIALVGLVLLWPLLLAACVLVRFTSQGPALFHGARVGLDGRPFRIHKLRTMTHGAAGPAVSAAGEARVTALGGFLRRTRIDELPQLWNVLVGEMSLVGPRPEDPRFVDVDDPAWRRILSVRPGITGRTQLAFAAREAGVLDPADPEGSYRERVLPQKVAMDAAYVEGRSLAGDAAIVVRTCVAALRLWR